MGRLKAREGDDRNLLGEQFPHDSSSERPTVLARHETESWFNSLSLFSLSSISVQSSIVV